MWREPPAAAHLSLQRIPRNKSLRYLQGCMPLPPPPPPTHTPQRAPTGVCVPHKDTTSATDENWFHNLGTVGRTSSSVVVEHIKLDVVHQ